MQAGATPGNEELAEALVQRLAAVASPERAAGEKRYLKSDLTFLGATLWQIRDAVSGLPASGRDEVVGLAETLWAQPVHERRMAAVVLLERSAGMLGTEELPFVERLIRESRTWAYVDALAAKVVGWIAWADPAGARAALDRWAQDPDFWVRRSALLALLPSLGRGVSRDGAFGQFSGYADAMLDEQEFFIRKAIGWVLREDGKHRPDEVVAWLGPRTHRASGVTLREAVKYLPPPDRERLLTAYRQHRPAS